jgi:glycosyl transferase, family 25
LTDWPIFVITMDGQERRWQSASSQLAAQGLCFDRLPAIAGSALSASDIAAAYDAERNRRVWKTPMTVEEIGCYLSHIAAWTKIAASGVEAGIILEDDFLAAPQLADILRRLPAAATSEWDIIKLHCGPAIEGNLVEPLTPQHGLFALQRVPIRTLGYVISREAAARLAAVSRPFSRPIDIDHKHFWEHDLRIFAVFPSLLDIDPTFLADSTIGDSRKKLRESASTREAIGRGMRHFRDEFRYQIALRRRRKRP